MLLPLDDAAARIAGRHGQRRRGHDLVPGPVARLPTSTRPRSSRRPSSEADADAEPTRRRPPGRRRDAPRDSCVTGHPIDALAAKVAEVDGREAIILTEEHFVAELLRVDWTSQARRQIDVPVLHLMEQENFDEQAGGGEGVVGL